ncbi:MAG: QueT transporter family protein [Anaerorhabdus sp.]
MKVKNMSIISLIAAIYVALTLVLGFFSFGPIQIRISEALTLLPLIYPLSIWGVTIGCFISNLFGAMLGTNLAGFMDVIIGTSATLLAAVLTYKFRNIKFFKMPLLSISMPIIINAVVIGLELSYVLMPQAMSYAIPLFMFQVGLGELISIIIFGVPLVYFLKKSKIINKMK